MGLRIVCGRAGTGKSYYCIKDIVRSLKEDSDRTDRLIFLVPEQFTVQAEKMLLSEPDCGKSIIRADVVNFKRMAHRAINAGVDGNAVKVIDNPGRRMILYKAIEECKDSLRMYRNALIHLGLVGELLELIDEMGRYDFSDEKMESVVQKLPEDLPIRQKLAELAIISRNYKSILHEKYVDDKDLMDILSERILEHNLYDGVKVWIDGFFGFTAQEYAIITALMHRASEVTVTLCCDTPEIRKYKESDFLRSVYKTYDNLVRIAQENNIKIEETVFLKNSTENAAMKARHGRNPMLAHFEAEYDSYPVKVFSGSTSTSIELFAARNIYTEVENAACKIIELCRDMGLRYRDIGVVAKNIETYAPACKDIFEQNNIPFFIDSKKDLLRHPLARLIVSALDIITENFSYRSVFTYLKTGMLSYDQEMIDMIENHVLSRNINSLKKWTDSERWEIATEEEDTALQMLAQRDEILRPLMTFKENMSKSAGVIGKAEALYNFLCEIKLDEIIVNRQESERTDRGQSGEYIKIWNGLLNVLDKMAEALGNERVSVEKFTNIFKAGLENYQIGEIPSTVDSVQIGSLGRTINARIKVLFFLGVNEGIVPGGAAKEGLLTDGERLLLKENNVNLAADSHEQAYLEEFQIYAALMAPSDNLFVSYPIKDISGKSQRPSRIVSRIQKMFPDIKLRDDIITEQMYKDPIGSLISQEYVFSKYLCYLGSSSRTCDSRRVEVWEGVGKYFSNKKEYKERLERAVSYRNVRTQELCISAESAKQLFGENIVSSISQVERYNLCPYSFYLEYGIAAKEREVPAFNNKEAGTFVHEILEKIGGNLDEENVNAAVKAVLEGKDKFSIRESKRADYLAKRTGNMVKRVVDIISRQMKSTQFKFFEFEADCNMRVKLLDGKYARLVGKIDRIDSYSDGVNNYYRVIDYKTGVKEFDFNDLYNGTSVQLFAYLDSVIKNNKNAIPAGGLYFNIRDYFLKVQSVMTQAEIEARKRRSYKFNGLLLADADIVRAMDENIGSSSEIVPAGINKDGTLSKRSQAASKEEFERLFSYVENVIADAIQGYASGKIAPQPLKDRHGGTPCQYCRYYSICEFDTRCGDKYKIAKDIGKGGIWDRIP